MKPYDAPAPPAYENGKGAGDYDPVRIDFSHPFLPDPHLINLILLFYLVF
jgi:hypothetical protein